eukprot:gnl/TRDRNA2_/TRDRNA2_97220_c1_seq1.p1 gnl/TRDRNA2_/TRDRNA2_97220_c1~~gnl/TRDRNA2_/TRDRNA2_97220_c1_seq1.p1  ORF type:complete len:337 (+),score=66.08 gnl/TRDRNA2_/TRDRNA2_97220_c1_seq1:89-1012(+)
MAETGMSEDSATFRFSTHIDAKNSNASEALSTPSNVASAGPVSVQSADVPQLIISERSEDTSGAPSTAPVPSDRFVQQAGAGLDTAAGQIENAAKALAARQIAAKELEIEAEKAQAAAAAHTFETNSILVSNKLTRRDAASIGIREPSELRSESPRSYSEVVNAPQKDAASPRNDVASRFVQAPSPLRITRATTNKDAATTGSAAASQAEIGLNSQRAKPSRASQAAVRVKKADYGVPGDPFHVDKRSVRDDVGVPQGRAEEQMDQAGSNIEATIDASLESEGLGDHEPAEDDGMDQDDNQAGDTED